MGQFITFIINHWVLWLALVVVLLIIFFNEKMDKQSKAGQLSPQEAVNFINDSEAIVFDCRDAEKFEKGHIIHAIRATEQDFSKKSFEKYKTKSILLTCTDGVQSTKLALTLQKQGFSNIVVLS